MLILVVWTISLLSILAMSVGSRCAFALSLTERLEGQLRAAYVASAAVQQATAVLALDQNTTVDGVTDNWVENVSAFSHRGFGQGRFSVGMPDPKKAGDPFRYGLIDQERFININGATPEILKRLIQNKAPVKDLEATTLAESIADWRDKDKEPLPSGAEDFYYLSLNPAYECKDAPFESLEELLLIRGMSPAVYAAVKPYLTVFGSGSVNINTADDSVLHALGISPLGVQSLLAYRAGEDDTLGSEDDRALHSVNAVSSELLGIPAEDANRLAELASKKLAGVGSTAFEARVTAYGDEKTENAVQVVAVMDREGRMLSWEEN